SLDHDGSVPCLDPWSRPQMTRRRWLVSLAVVVLVGYYAASSLRLMNGPGFSPDEMLFVNAARTGKDYAYCERWHGIPILVMPYIGALKSYLYYPIFIPFRVSIASVRVPVIAITCVSLVLAYVLTRRFFDVGRSLLVLGLLCTDPNLILMTTFDW